MGSNDLFRSRAHAGLKGEEVRAVLMDEEAVEHKREGVVGIVS